MIEETFYLTENLFKSSLTHNEISSKVQVSSTLKQSSIHKFPRITQKPTLASPNIRHHKRITRKKEPFKSFWHNFFFPFRWQIVILW